MSDNEEVEQEIKDVIHSVLHAGYDMDSIMAGEAANRIYDLIWEYIKDYD